MHVRFERAETVAEGVQTFWFRPERPVRYIAGQFTELYVPHQADARGQRRWFTLSSSPSEELVSITTKFALQNGSSFKRQLINLSPGAKLHLADPMGDFVLPKDASIPLLFVAAGLGITPVRSMIKWLHDTGERRNAQLLYAASQPEELAFTSLFKEYKMDFTPFITSQRGPLATAHILNLAQAKPNALIYLSGPELMVEMFYKELKANGLPEERLVTDYFPGYQPF